MNRYQKLHNGGRINHPSLLFAMELVRLQSFICSGFEAIRLGNLVKVLFPSPDSFEFSVGLLLLPLTVRDRNEIGRINILSETCHRVDDGTAGNLIESVATYFII